MFSAPPPCVAHTLIDAHRAEFAGAAGWCSQGPVSVRSPALQLVPVKKESAMNQKKGNRS
jgi:hypothetical protein